MKFITKSGSMYEVDTSAKRIRRLIGMVDPTPRQGKDGEWRVYADLFPSPTVGKSVIIAWCDVPLLEENEKELSEDSGFAMAITTTSVVVSIETDLAN